MQRYNEKKNAFQSKSQMLLNDEILAEKGNNERPEKERFHLHTRPWVKYRNERILKAIEMSRARIRSLALYSPLESILQKAICDYICLTLAVNQNKEK